GPAGTGTSPWPCSRRPSSAWCASIWSPTCRRRRRRRDKRGGASRRRGPSAVRGAAEAAWRSSPRSGGPQEGAGPAAPGGPPPHTGVPPDSVAELIPLTVPEVRRLLSGVVWRALAPVEHVLAWSRWRRHHQAVAKRCHYRRRGVILP